MEYMRIVLCGGGRCQADSYDDNMKALGGSVLNDCCRVIRNCTMFRQIKICILVGLLI